MVYSQQWTAAYNALPQLSQKLKDTLQQTLVGLKVNITERMNSEHYWATGTDNDGEHKFRSGPTSGRPAGTLYGRLYFNGDRWTPEFYSSGWLTFLHVAGSRLLSFRVGVPTGWTLVASFADRVIRINTDTGQAGALGGDWTITGFADAGAVNLSNTFTSAGPSAAESVQSGIGESVPASGHSHNVLVEFSIGNHGHAFTPGWRPAYVDAYVMEKN